jgi:hypothetical protein
MDTSGEDMLLKIALLFFLPIAFLGNIANVYIHRKFKISLLRVSLQAIQFIIMSYCLYSIIKGVALNNGMSSIEYVRWITSL